MFKTLVWWGQVSKNDLLCIVTNPTRAFAPTKLEVTCSPRPNLKLSYMKSLMEKKKCTHKRFGQHHPFFCSNSHSDYKIITDQFVFPMFINLNKELGDLLATNKWRLKLPNIIAPELQARSYPAQMASTYVTVAAVSWIKDPSRSCHAEEFLLESSRCLGKSY